LLHVDKIYFASGSFGIDCKIKILCKHKPICRFGRYLAVARVDGSLPDCLKSAFRLPGWQNDKKYF